MPLHRLLHRLDYPFNEFICDRPGSVIRTMMDVGKQRIPEVNDSAPNRTLITEGVSEDVRWRLQFTPLNAFVGIEWASPRNIGTVLKDADASAIFDVVTAVFDISHIDLMNRAGLRLFSYTDIQHESPLHACLSKLDKGITSVVERSAGEITDVGINFDGKIDGGLTYSLRHGPYFKSEQHKYFELLKEDWELGDVYNFIVDVDFAQSNFRMKGQGPYKWSRALLERAQHLTEGLFKTGSKI